MCHQFCYSKYLPPILVEQLTPFWCCWGMCSAFVGPTLRCTMPPAQRRVRFEWAKQFHFTQPVYSESQHSWPGLNNEHLDELIQFSVSKGCLWDTIPESSSAAQPCGAGDVACHGVAFSLCDCSLHMLPFTVHGIQ